MCVRAAGDNGGERLLAEENAKRFVAPNVLRGEVVKTQRRRDEDQREQDG